MKIRRVRWMGQLFRMQGVGPCRKLTVLKPEGTRCVGEPKLKSVGEDLMMMDVRNC